MSNTPGPEAAVELRPLTSVRGINWYTEKLDAALADASTSGKLTCIYFWANTATCSRFYRDVLSDQKAHQALGELVCFSADASSEYGHELAQKFGVETVPALYFLTADGTPEDVIFGYLDAESLASEVDRVEREEKTVRGFRKQIETTPEDFELRGKLIAKLGDLGESDAQAAEREALMKLDPRAKTYIGASAHFVSLKYEAYAYKAEYGSLDLKPMYKFANRVKNEEIQAELWTWLATGETIEKNDKGIRRAYKKWWKVASAQVEELDGELSGFLNPACNLVQAFFDNRESGMSAKELALVLEVAEAVNALVDRAGIPKSDSVWANIYNTMGLAKWLNQDEEAAFAFMDRAIEAAPEDDFYQNNLETMREG